MRWMSILIYQILILMDDDTYVIDWEDEGVQSEIEKSISGLLKNANVRQNVE